ncbi:BrnT family toxin [Salinivibrio sp. IB282]|uniref:BrnT family toxin n=1 Tax=Salinivibrio sp. IB282 TaxID=1766122 RepID=UPI0009885444|nr:BrnT family toxin [Salinivibrio sp. IB282]OOE57558.1 toxin [Salinivibrio sp. IB282]
MGGFEFDENKSRLNATKHGIDFQTAQGLWDDPYLIEIPAKTSDEPGYVVLGLLNRKYWSGVITYRGNNIRIISVRRSRKAEVSLYESA